MPKSAFPPLDHQRIGACVESLCEKGCREVWGVIAALERGEVLPETAPLPEPERRVVLQELKEVMAVYAECRVK